MKYSSLNMLITTLQFQPQNRWKFRTAVQHGETKLLRAAWLSITELSRGYFTLPLAPSLCICNDSGAQSSSSICDWYRRRN